MQNNLEFHSTVSVILTYHILRIAPLVALVYYFFTWQWAILCALILITLILIHSARTNHNFSLSEQALSIAPSISIFQKKHSFDYRSIQYIEIKYAKEKDDRQWLAIHLSNSPQPIHFRCDWLHTQDPPDEDEDDHGHPEHELFELLEEEDFYDGSLQQLGYELQQKGLKVQEV